MNASLMAKIVDEKSQGIEFLTLQRTRLLDKSVSFLIISSSRRMF